MVICESQLRLLSGESPVRDKMLSGELQVKAKAVEWGGSRHS